jgi:hypothetical protein
VTHPIVGFLSECPLNCIENQFREIVSGIDQYGDMKPHEATPSNHAIRIIGSFFSKVCAPAVVILPAIGLFHDQPLRQILAMFSPSY